MFTKTQNKNFIERYTKSKAFCPGIGRYKDAEKGYASFTIKKGGVGGKREEQITHNLQSYCEWVFAIVYEFGASVGNFGFDKFSCACLSEY